MTLTKTIAKAEKLSGSQVLSNGCEYWVNYKGYTISFMSNGRIEDNKDAVCFYVTKEARTNDDVNSDYFPGTFWDNLTQCFKSVDRKQG